MVANCNHKDARAQGCQVCSAQGRDLLAIASLPMPADEETIATRSKKPHALVEERFGDFWVVE
jgi:hypothetical protein